MAHGDSRVVVSGGIILNKFRRFLERLSQEIEEDQLQGLKFLLKGSIPSGHLEKCSKPRDLFSKMIQQGLLGEDNLGNLEKLLTDVRRLDLVKRVTAYRQSESPAVELVCFSFGMQEADVNVQKNLVHSMNAFLGFDPSEIHLERSEQVGVNWWNLNFKIPNRKEMVDNLRWAAIHKLPWLNHCGVKAVRIGNESQILLQPITRSLSLITPDCNHDDKNLDLILVVDCALSNPVLLQRLKTQLRYLINDIFDSFHLRLALISYQNHQRHPRPGMRSGDPQINKTALIQKFTDRRDAMKETIENLRRLGRPGGTRGLADGLALAVQLSEVGDDNDKCRRNAIKVCILLPILDQRKTLENFRCEHGHDVMKLCHQLTKNYVTLHTIVVPQPEPAYIPDPAHDLVTDFFTGISLKTGGKFFQIPDVKFIFEVARCIIGANISEEHLFGTAYDIIIEEIRKTEGGDVSLEDLNIKLQEGLNQRSFHVSRVLFNGQLAIGPATKLAKKFSLDEDFPSACETFQSALEKRRQSTRNIVAAPGTPSDVDMEEAQTTTSQFSLSTDCVITTEVSERILQRVVQRRFWPG
ncbi:uncharacterized protein [Pocillopora verrucosa]|uniref:uncharacterized protein n=1 Tax=Pocillopora verrucosa TaxID=203993 RepID=UPI003341C3D3